MGFSIVRRPDTRYRSAFTILSLVVFIAVIIVIVHPTKWTFLPNFNPTQPHVSKVFRECRQFSRKERINWNYLYYYEDRNTRQSLVWCKVPKAGSTTLTKMFLRLAGARQIQNSTKIHRLLRTFYPQLNNKVMTRRMKTSFKFLVVRDPFERILSAYRDKLENYERDLKYREGFYYNTYGKLMVRSPVTSGKIKEPTFEEFVSYLITTNPKAYDEHWMPISRLCAPCNIRYDAIVKMEKFGSDIRVPLKQAGIFSDVGWAHSTGTSDRQVIQRYFRNLSVSQVQKLYIKYRKDFQLFGYSPSKYYAMIEPLYNISSTS